MLEIINVQFIDLTLLQKLISICGLWNKPFSSSRIGQQINALFYSEYFGVGKKLHLRVKQAREWLDENHSKYSFLSDSIAAATGQSEISMTQTSSKDGLLSPLPWFVDRVGAMASNVSNAHEL